MPTSLVELASIDMLTIDKELPDRDYINILRRAFCSVPESQNGANGMTVELMDQRNRHHLDASKRN